MTRVVFSNTYDSIQRMCIACEKFTVMGKNLGFFVSLTAACLLQPRERLLQDVCEEQFYLAFAAVDGYLRQWSSACLNFIPLFYFEYFREKPAALVNQGS